MTMLCDIKMNFIFLPNITREKMMSVGDEWREREKNIY
jgi:hypothetical protein